MLLTIDVGNTNIVIGGYEGEKLALVSRIATSKAKTEDEYAANINEILTLNRVDKTDVDAAIISSVVPPLNAILKKALQKVYGVTPMIVGPGIKTGINLRVDNPNTVGADIICAGVAAHEKYDGPVLVLDMGTATKMLVVDGSGAFVGVVIIPGVEICMRALASNTAQLPQISLEIPENVLGRNTIDCMRSGIIFGNASMIDGMVDRIEKEYGQKLKLVATGGLSSAIIPCCTHSFEQDDYFILEGLRILYKKNMKQ